MCNYYQNILRYKIFKLIQKTKIFKSHYYIACVCKKYRITMKKSQGERAQKTVFRQNDFFKKIIIFTY